MKILITLLKPFSFAPAILMMILIYSFSAQTGDISGNLSYQISYTIVETKNEVLNEGKGYEELAYEADGKRINDFPSGETYAANSFARIICCKKQSPPTSADGFYYWSR